MKTKILFLSPYGTGGIRAQVLLLHNALAKKDVSSRLFTTTKKSGPLSLFSIWRLGWFVLEIVKNRPKICYLPLASGGSFYRKSAFGIISTIFRIPFIVHLHGGGFEGFFKRLKPPSRWLASWLFKRAKHVYILHTGQLEVCKLILGRTLEGKVSVLPNGVEIPESPRSWKKNNLGEKLSAIYIGDVTKRKGIDSLLQLNHFLKSNNVQVNVVGNILPDVKKSISSTSKFDLSQFNFLGPLSRGEVLGLLSNSQLLILPSRVENFPNVILEAFAAGVPVVASRAGGIPELVSDNKTGWLLKSKVVTPETLQDALSKALANRTKFGDFGERAFMEASSKYDINLIAERLNLEVNRLLNG